MNDPANFGTNENRAFNWPEEDKPYWTLKCPQNKYDDPPYRTSEFLLHTSYISNTLREIIIASYPCTDCR